MHQWRRLWFVNILMLGIASLRNVGGYSVGRFSSKHLKSVSAVISFPSQRPYSSSLYIFKESKGFGQPPSIPSIDELANQQRLKTLMGDYKNSKRKVFEDNLTFPTAFVIKVIGTNEPNFVPDVLATVARCVGCASSEIPHSVKPSDTGNFLSITIKPTFADATQLYATYETVGKDSRVKFVL